MSRQGYVDYQRTVNWDGPLLLNLNGVEFTGKSISEVLDVQRYAYLAGELITSLEPVEVRLTWWADKAGTIRLGSRRFVLIPTIGAGAQIRILNLGPYVTVDFEPGAEFTKWVLTARLFPSNRVHPLEMVPQLPVVMNETFNLVAKEVRLMTPLTYCAAPCNVHFVTGFADVAFRFYWRPAAASEAIFSERVFPKSTDTDAIIVMPLGGWFVRAENPGAEASVSSACVIVPSITGAT